MRAIWGFNGCGTGDLGGHRMWHERFAKSVDVARAAWGPKCYGTFGGNQLMCHGRIWAPKECGTVCLKDTKDVERAVW